MSARELPTGLGRRVARAVRRRLARQGNGDRVPRVEGVDVVVPVHDARADVERCLDSVLARGTGDFRLVVVDDASRDPHLIERLDALASRDRRVVLLRNGDNLGFVKSVNRGMAAGPRRDVLLLNSDTVVPPGFLHRLRAAAYATPRTGVVSPFTNNGTILSLPEFMLDNPLPEGLDVAAFDALVAGTSPRLRPEIFTAHGFCMYLRRALLDQVGVFDEAFGRGYGEENDLCERAKAAGWEVRLCDDVFVGHRGSASFAGETDPLRTANLDLLGRRHPGYHAGVQRFIRANPLAELQGNVRYQLARRARRRARALLVVLHADPFADPRREPVGGTQMHVLDLVRALALPRVAVAWPDGADVALAEVADGDLAGALAHRFPLAPDAAPSARGDRFALADPEREQRFAEMLDVLDVGGAHLHHLSGWPARIWRALAARDIPFAFTVHDYLCTCPSFYRLDLTTLAPCACLEGSSADAERCLRAFHQACGLPPPGDALARVRAQRAEYGALLAAASSVIAPSEAARELVARAFPDTELRWHVVPHAAAAAPAGARRRADGGALRVALLGAPSAPWKGADTIVDVMRATRDLGLEWHVFGDAGAYDFPRRAADALGDAARERLHLHGRYARDEIVPLLVQREVDVALLPSPWAETFSYTLSEAWAAGVPAIVLDRGAPAERVRATGAGLVVADADAVPPALRALHQDRERLHALAEAAHAAAAREPSASEGAARHRAAYGAMLDALAPRTVDPPWTSADRRLFGAHRAALAHARAQAVDDPAPASPSR